MTKTYGQPDWVYTTANEMNRPLPVDAQIFLEQSKCWVDTATWPAYDTSKNYQMRYRKMGFTKAEADEIAADFGLEKTVKNTSSEYAMKMRSAESWASALPMSTYKDFNSLVGFLREVQKDAIASLVGQIEFFEEEYKKIT